MIENKFARAYLTSPPPKFSDFFGKSEGKEVERKRNENRWGDGLIANIFLGVEIFSSRVEIFLGGLRNFWGGGLRNFLGGGVRIFLGGGGLRNIQ